jgi:hypothetical protein
VFSVARPALGPAAVLCISYRLCSSIHTLLGI